MSSSIFAESPVSTNESRMSDSNLVVVYGKNGVNNVDREGLENLIDDKGVSTISVVRLTSPTPSMRDEEETENESKKNKKKECEDKEKDNIEKKCRNEDLEQSEKSTDSELESEEGSGEDLETIKKLPKEKPEAVGLIIEDFCLPEKTKEITKAALALSGLQPLTVSVDLEIQIKALKNDHCYTPLTSPRELLERKPEPKPLSTSSISAVASVKAAQKMAVIKAKNAANRAAVALEKSIENDTNKKMIDESDDNESVEDENESDYSDSEDSADTDNDRDSDLDFDVNDRTGRKRKTNKKIPKRKLKNKIMKKRQSTNNENNSCHDDDKKSKSLKGGLDKLYTAQTISQPPASSSNSNIQKITSAKYNAIQSSAKMLITTSKMEIRVQNRLQSSNSTQAVVKSIPQIQITQKNSRPDVLSNIITGTGKPSGDPSGKPVVQNVVIIKPPNKRNLGNVSGGFTDITKYLSKPDNMRASNVQVCELIKPDISGAIILRRSEQDMKSALNTNNIISNLSPSRIPKKGFMPLVPDKAKSQMLPAQISVQVQQKIVKTEECSPENMENKKGEDIIDSLVGQIQTSQQTKSSVNTLKIVKTYEGPNTPGQNVFNNPQISQKKSIIIHSSTSHSPFASATSQVDSVDISNAPLLETPDDIPEDLIKDMAELIDHKTLQELVEEQQQEQLQNQRLHQSFNVTDFETSIPKNFLMQPIHQSEMKNDFTHNTLIKSQKINESNRDDNELNQKDPAIKLAGKNNYNTKESQSFSLQQPVQVVSKSGRVITLPPIEAPTTRAKRRAAAGITTSDTPTPPVSSNVSEASESEFLITPKSVQTTKQHHRGSNSRRNSKDQQKRTAMESVKKQRQPYTTISTSEDYSENESSQGEDEDDPNKLWCICRQPHNNRFMICCDNCEDWFHGTCVGVTKSMGKEMELKKIEWTCPNCKDGKKQQNIKIMFEKQAVELTTNSNLSTSKFAVQDKKEKIQNSTKRVNNRKSSEAPIIPTLITPLSKSMQQKISEIIGVPLPEPILPSPTENADTHSQSMVAQKKKTLKGSRPLAKEMLEKSFPCFNKKKTPPKLKDHDLETVKLNEITEKIAIDTKEKPSESEIIFCIVCKKQQARPNSIYCSDDCIRKHAHNALSFKATKSQSLGATSPGLGSDGVEKKKKQPSSFEEALGNASLPTPKKIERVCVFERKTGKILTGNNAPTTANLKRWLQENPTFEVIQPGSPQAQAVERNKQKQKSQIVMTPEAQQRTVQSYRQQSTRPQSQQKHVIKIIKSISSNPSPKSDGQLHEINEVMHKSIPQKLLTFNHVSPSKGEKSETKVEITPENTESKIEKLEKSKFDKTEKNEKTEKQSKLEKSPNKMPIKKQTSKEKEKDKTESDKEKTQSSEPIRLNVKRTLKEKLITRLAETAEENHSKMSELECEKYANETEEEMFELFKDTGVKYKAKYRSLAFNIKDHKNKTLFRKICEKSIEPKQLVRMTPEELASQELAQWRENENKHQLEMIKKSELDLLSCAKNYVLKTHKGEEVIEDKLTDRVNLDITIPVEDVVAVLNNSTVSSTSEVEKTTINRDSLKCTTQTQENDIDSSLGISITKVDATLLEISESVCEADNIKKKASKKDKEKERRYKSKDRYREKSSRRSRSRSKSRDRKRRKTPQKEEESRSCHHKTQVKEKFSQSPEQSIDIQNQKDAFVYYDEVDGNNHPPLVQHEPEEELHGFEENDSSSKCKYNLSSSNDNKKRREKDEKSENFEYAIDEVEQDRNCNKLDKKEGKPHQCSRYRSEDDKNIHHDHKRRSYTHSPSLDEDDERKKRRHQSLHSAQIHQHHRSTLLITASSPSLESEEYKKDVISKLKNDMKSSTPTSTTTSEILVSSKKYASSGISKQNFSNKMHKNKLVNQKSHNTDLSEYSLIDKIFAESEKTIEEAANLVPVVLGKEKSLVKPADSQSSTPKYTSEIPDFLRDTKDLKRSDSSGNDSEHELPSSTVTIPTPPEDPYKQYASDISTIIWTGNINMIDVATFNIIIQPISGNCANIEKEFPMELDVVGRIGPDTVWDYIGKIKKSPNKEIVLVRLVPSPESETNAYTALYLYLEKRKRLGVVKSTSPGIKDFYVLPLHAKTELPTILQTAFISEFLDDDSKPDLLVGIIIRIMDFGHSKRYTTPSTSSSSVLSETISKIVRKPLPPTSSSSVLRGETTVIQNKKLLGLGESADLTEEDYKPESPHMSMSGPKIFSIMSGKPTENTREVTALAVQLTPDKGIYEADDADEPYSPGGSSDEDLNNVSIVKGDITPACVSNTANISVSTDELQRKVEELTRQIEKEKKEIENLGSVALPATTADLAPALANISIPSNLQQILASIQKPDQASDQISMEKSNDILKNHEISTTNINNEEYNPEIGFYNINTEAESKVFNSKLTHKPLPDGGSRLANLSEAELLKMVPDNIDLTDSNSNSKGSAEHQNSSPPPKKSRWDIDPPPPGLEDEYE